MLPVLFFFPFLASGVHIFALMIPFLEIQLEEEGKPLQILEKKKQLGDEANVFFSINPSMESVQARESPKEEEKNE